jgi:acyl-CoA thioesterase FadM
MSAEMVSRWPVLLSLPVVDGDTDERGCLTDDGVERLFAEARHSYFDMCTTVDEAAIEVRGTSIQRGNAVVGDDGVTISVQVTEIFPDSFTMTARVRPRDRSDLGANASCSLSAGEVTTEMRDEFIALAHNARHMH